MPPRLRYGLAGLALGALAVLAGVASAAERLLPVPLVTIYPGDVIQQRQLELRRFADEAELATAIGEFDLLVGKAARRTLLPGRPIPRNSVDEPILIRIGSAVTIVYREGSLAMRTVGQALQSGPVGATVKVRNSDSGRVIDARVEADGSVSVSAE